MSKQGMFGHYFVEGVWIKINNNVLKTVKVALGYLSPVSVLEGAEAKVEATKTCYFLKTSVCLKVAIINAIISCSHTRVYNDIISAEDPNHRPSHQQCLDKWLQDCKI